MSTFVAHALFIAVAVYCIILFLLSGLIVRSEHSPHTEKPVPGPEEMSHHVFWGIYYCNPDDPRGWVPKSGDPAHSNGYTINLRHRSWAIAYNVVFIGGIVVIMLIGITPLLLH